MSKDKQAVSDDQEQFWQMVLESRRESGLSVAAFCRQEGLSETAYYYWRKKLEPAGLSRGNSTGNGVPADPGDSSKGVCSVDGVPAGPAPFKSVTRRQKTGVPLPTVAPADAPAASFVALKTAAAKVVPAAAFVEVSLPVERPEGLELVFSSGNVLRIPVFD